MGIRFICFLLFFIFTTPCLAADKASLVREGNQLYNKGKIDEALGSYNKALTKAPEEPLINFNIGNAFYRKQQYKAAASSYEKALLSPDKKQEAKANYNIGNSKFRQGRTKESSDLAGAIIEYRQSLDYYKRAMELDSDDKDAKFNHEFVEKYLKMLLEKFKKQQQQQEKSGQQGQEGQKTEEQEKQEQQAQAQQAQPQQEYQAGGEIAKEGKELDKEMTKEEAGILLNESRQQEQQERQLGEKHAPMRYQDVEKDW